MTDELREAMHDQLRVHEDDRRFPYVDSVGKITIGIGRNLTDSGISPAESVFLCDNDLDRCERELLSTFTWYAPLDTIRQMAMLDLDFNLGLTKLIGFRVALSAMARQDYDAAADAFFDSRWATQVGHRAVTVCGMIRTGAVQI